MNKLGVVRFGYCMVLIYRVYFIALPGLFGVGVGVCYGTGLIFNPQH